MQDDQHSGRARLWRQGKGSSPLPAPLNAVSKPSAACGCLIARPMEDSMKVLFFAAMLAAAPGLLAQQDEDEWLDNCREYESRRRVAHCEIKNTGYRQVAGGLLTAEPNQNGGVSIRGWDRDSVHVQARIRTVARTEDAARALSEQIRILTERGNVRASGPSLDRDANWHVSFIIYVPRRTDVRAETHNGPIGLTQIEGNIDVRAVNGPIALRELAGDVRARAQNGPISITLGEIGRAHV